MTLTFLLSFLIGFTETIFSQDGSKKSSYNFLFAGGALKTCSTLAPKNCIGLKEYFEEHKIPQQSYLFENRYEVSAEAIKSLNRLAKWGVLGDQRIAELVTASQGLQKKARRRSLTESALIDLFDETLGKSRKLRGREFDVILDIFEKRPMIEGREIKEKVILAQNQNKLATAIFQKFVQMARETNTESNRKKRNKPKIVFLTSSARDPFAAVYFYKQVFEQAGGDAFWLPLDRAVTQAQKTKSCKNLPKYRALLQGNYSRKERYPELTAKQLEFCTNPEKMLSLLKSAQGLFINGGDQSLSLEALRPDAKDSEFLKVIREQVNAGKLVVGGTSAGAAIQSGGTFAGKIIPMISNGTNRLAIEKGAVASMPPGFLCEDSRECQSLDVEALTYEKQGGLGLLPSGIFDTHFSERGRQIRLVKLAADTKTRFAFGIDETTAMLGKKVADTIVFEAFGESGVWVFDLGSHFKTKKSDGVIQNVKASYLTHGDLLEISWPSGDIRILPAASKKTLRRDISEYSSSNGKQVESVLTREVLTSDLEENGLLQEINAWITSHEDKLLIKPSKKTQTFFRSITIVPGEKFAARVGRLRVANKEKISLSFYNLRLTLAW